MIRAKGDGWWRSSEGDETGYPRANSTRRTHSWAKEPGQGPSAQVTKPFIKII